MDQLFAKKQNVGSISGDPSITTAVKSVMLVVQHNTFSNIVDHLAPLIRKEFSQSRAGRNFACVETKTAAIASCIGDHFFDGLKEKMTQSSFSIMLDGSNDTGLQKMYPVTVRIFDVNFNRMTTRFFDMNLLEGTDASTAASMFDSVNNLFERYNIQWDHCMGIGLDNRNAKIGERNSIKS